MSTVGSRSYYKSKGRRPRNLMKAKRMKKVAEKVVHENLEKLTFQTSSAGANLSALSAGSSNYLLDDLFPISQGDLVSSRSGNSIDPNVWTFNYRISAPTYDATDGDYQSVSVRVLLFQWYEDNSSAAPSVNDILASTGDTVSIVSPYQTKLHQQKFKVFHDKVHSLNQLITQSKNRTGCYKVHIAKGMKKLLFDGTSTTGQNKLYALAFSDYGGVNTKPQITFFSQLRYFD